MWSLMRFCKLGALTSLIILISVASAWASTVERVRGQRVIVRIQGVTVAPGEEVITLDASGQRRGAIKIDRVRGARALGTIQRGQVRPGMKVVTAKSASAAGSGKLLGIMGGLHQNTMAVNQNTTSTNYAGNSFSFAGFLDFPMGESFTLRGKTGLTQFQAQQGDTGSSFSYLSFEGGVNWNLSSSFWLGGGAGFLVTMAKSSNIPGLSTDAATNSFFYGGLGYNYRLSSGKVLPLSLEYALFPSGAGVSANSIMIRAGYAWSL